MGRFDRDQYQLLLNQFEGLKQKGSVTEYQIEFEKLAHGMLLYNDQYDDTYFVTYFMVRLKEEIRAAIALHRPRDVATASALATLQEEELNRCRPKNLGQDFTKGTFKPVLDKMKGEDHEKTKATLNKTKGEDKLASLRDFRRKNGL